MSAAESSNSALIAEAALEVQRHEAGAKRHLDKMHPTNVDMADAAHHRRNADLLNRLIAALQAVDQQAVDRRAVAVSMALTPDPHGGSE